MAAFLSFKLALTCCGICVCV